MEMNEQVQAQLEKLSKLPQAARVGIVLGISLLVAAGYYFLSYDANQQELQRLHAQELELQRKLSEVRSVAANIGAFEEEIEALQIKLKSALRQLPDQKQLEVLLTDISNLGKKAGVEIRSFVRKDEVMHDFYSEVPISIALEGEYHSVGKFFELMAKLPRIVNMGALKVDVKNENIDGTRLTVTGTATTFRFIGSGA